MKVVNLLNMACRPRKAPPTTVVLHATAGQSAESSISWLRKIGLSYHVIIGDGQKQDDGVVYKGVPIAKVAFHAGKSIGPNGANVNEYSVGVSFACMDDGKDMITEKQWLSAIDYVAQQVIANPSIKWITTHAIIAPKRKVDPRGPVHGIKWDNKFPLGQFVLQVNEAIKHSGRRVEAWYL